MPDSKSEAVLYAELLKCKGMGHAFWYPGPNDALGQQCYKDSGVRIGDLGVLCRDGTFDFLWNVACSKDDPVNLHVPKQPTFKLPNDALLPVADFTTSIRKGEETVSQYVGDLTSP
jgi:hypothetical protein